MPNKKILVVCQHFWPESFRINDICDYLQDEQYEIDVLCGIPNYPKGYFFEGYGLLKNKKQRYKDVNIYRSYEIPRKSNSNIRIFLNYMSFPFTSLFRIPRLLRKDYDKIFMYQLSPVMMSIAGLIIGKIKKKEKIMYVLDLWPENLFSVIDVQNKFARKLLTKVSHWHYRQADKIIVLSQAMKDKIQKITNLPDDKLIIVPQACEKFYEEPIVDEVLNDRFKGKFNIVYAGNISPAQSFETILDAAELLDDGERKNINFIIVGEGMSYKWLREEVEKRDLVDLFTFEGQMPPEEIPRYTTIADALIGCLVKSDLLEATIPAKVMSYLAAGKPLLLSMDGEVQDLVNNAIKCGYASETGDAKQLSENIKELYQTSESERQKMGTRALEYHFANFERNLVLSKLEAFMQS